MHEIQNGKKPSEVFRRLVEAKPDLDTWDLAQEFISAFPDVDSIVTTYIWRWKGPGATRGVDDERLDEVLLEQLSKAGYLK